MCVCVCGYHKSNLPSTTTTNSHCNSKSERGLDSSVVKKVLLNPQIKKKNKTNKKNYQNRRPAGAWVPKPIISPALPWLAESVLLSLPWACGESPRKKDREKGRQIKRPPELCIHSHPILYSIQWLICSLKYIPILIIPLITQRLMKKRGKGGTVETRRGRRESEKARKRSILPPFWLPAEDSFTLRICGLELKKKKKKKSGWVGNPWPLCGGDEKWPETKPGRRWGYNKREEKMENKV